MTRRAVVACHPDVDPSFLGLDADSIEIHQINMPFLEQMILIDCPDPDTQDPDDGDGGRRHLDILRAVLPHCDVMVHTVTSQKYKSHVVGQELRKNAPGRQILFVQTHAAIDSDNRDDLRKYLDALGLRVPEIYRFDAAEALAAAGGGRAGRRPVRPVPRPAGARAGQPGAASDPAGEPAGAVRLAALGDQGADRRAAGGRRQG